MSVEMTKDALSIGQKSCSMTQLDDFGVLEWVMLSHGNSSDDGKMELIETGFRCDEHVEMNFLLQIEMLRAEQFWNSLRLRKGCVEEGASMTVLIDRDNYLREEIFVNEEETVHCAEVGFDVWSWNVSQDLLYRSVSRMNSFVLLIDLSFWF